MASSDVFVTFGGDTGALEAAISVVKAQMTALTREMKSAASEFHKTGVAAESELGQKLKAMGAQMAAAKDHMAGLQSGAKGSGDAVKDMAQKIGDAAYNYGPWTGAHVQLAQAAGVGLATGFRSAGAAVGVLGAALGAVAVAAGASLAIIGAQTQKLRELDDAARGAHISMTALKNLNTAGAAVGVDAAQMNQEMAGFAAKLREAQVAGGDLADFLKQNNIAIKDAHGNLLPVQEVFGRIATLVLSSKNEMDRLAALSKLGFSSDMLRLIERQTEAVRAFAASAVSAQDNVMQRGLSDGEALSAAWHGTWSAVSEAALSMSVSVLGSIGEIEHQGAAEFDELANRAASAFARIAGDAQAAAAAATAAFNAQRAEVYRREGLDVAAGKSPFGALDVNAFGPQKNPPAPASDAPTIKGLYDKDSSGGKTKAPKADRSEENAAMKGFEDSIKAARTSEQAKESLLAEGVKLHLISEDEKLAATRKALNEEYAAEKTLLQKELQIAGLKLEQKQAINDKLKALDAKYASDSEKAFMQSVEKQVQGWNSMVDTMTNSLSSGITGMVEQTEGFRAAVLNLERSVLQSFVKMGADMVADWAKRQIALVVLSQTAEGQKTAAALTGASVREGVSAGEATASLAPLIANAAKAISVAAGQVGAEVAAFLAPIIGPAAVPAGVAAAGAVVAMGSYDIGAWQIDKDQIAMVHKGEMVMTAAQSEGLRNVIGAAQNSFSSGGSSGGDTHVHFNVSAMDAGSVKGWLGNNSRQIMKALNQAVRNGDHLGLQRLGV